MTKLKTAFLKVLAYDPFYWLILKSLIRDAHPHSPGELISFWKELKEVYDYFEANHLLPNIVITSQGEYRISGPEAETSSEKPSDIARTHCKSNGPYSTIKVDALK